MTSRLDLLNDGLDALGEPAAVSATITAQSSDWIKRVARQLDRSAKFIAEKHPWNWMTAIAQLQETETEEPVGWDYEFNKPANCLRICKLSIDGGWRSRPIAFEDRAGVILANNATVFLHFVDQARLEALGAWPEHFALAVALEAAWRASAGTNFSAAREERLEKSKVKALAEAKTWDGQQQSAKPRYDGALVSAARGGWKSRENA